MVRNLVMLTSMLVLFGCQESKQQDAKGNVETASAVIAVNTIKCESCVKTVTDALEQVEGVQKVSVDLEKKVANVQYVSAKVTLASLETAIAQAGYDANETKRSDVAYQALDKCCQ